MEASVASLGSGVPRALSSLRGAAFGVVRVLCALLVPGFGWSIAGASLPPLKFFRLECIDWVDFAHVALWGIVVFFLNPPLRRRVRGLASALGV